MGQRMTVPISPAAWRERFRRGEVRQTAALCPGHAQANMAFIPADVADDFEAFLRANPAACPLLARGVAGVPHLPGLADADLRTDLPLFRLFSDGCAVDRLPDITAVWRDDLVPFAIGCSLSFEADLVAAGVALRCHAPGVSCSAFDTSLPNRPAGPFGGNLVVSMRAIRADQVGLAIDVTRNHPDAHGAPVHTGDPAAIGVALDRPIDGLGLTDVLPGEVPVFWACGVTMERAITSARLPFALTHAPGHMLITDLRAGDRR
jgi:uncharacterized protein YcsI (UPF0317 family)